METQLTPDFASNTRSYTAKVANSASLITVRSTTNHPSASVDYLDGSNNTVADADDSAGGHQVDLAEGENTFRVKVTSEAGTTTRTYTLTVTRTPSVTFWTATLDAKDMIPAPNVGCDQDTVFLNTRCSVLLTETQFTIGPTTYTVWKVTNPNPHSNRVELFVRPNTLLVPDSSNLTFHADMSDLPFVRSRQSTPGSNARFTWLDAGGLRWGDGDTVQLRITGAGPHRGLLESPQTVDRPGDAHRFQFDLRLSEEVWIPYKDMRDHAFEVTNGTVIKAKRVTRVQRKHQGRRRMFSDHWRITVEPTDPDGNVTVVLQGKNCNQRGAVCNPYGDGLLTSPSIELEAPEEELSVYIETASVNRGPGLHRLPPSICPGPPGTLWRSTSIPSKERSVPSTFRPRRGRITGR